MKPTRRLQPASIMLAVLLCVTTGVQGGRLMLDRPAIVIDPDQPAYVQYAVQELAEYLREVSGNPVPVATSSEKKAASLIAVGPEVGRHNLGDALTVEGLGEEGYILKTGTKEGANVIVAAGAGPRGTKAAVSALMKLIQVEGQRPFLADSLDLSDKPGFARRGIHFNGWPFKYPHSFRRWREQDWQRYLDILAYQNVNLFYLWPFMEIMPVPLSPEDQAYLEECRRVVDYAQKKHGMEVWIMQCTNRVAKDRCGVADPKARPYWRPSQEDLKPDDPKHFEAIMASREALYRALDNVDGVCNIDSDPGYCFGCSLDDYVKVLKGCRDSLDRHNVHGKQARLMSWMWLGWGPKPEQGFDPEYQDRTLKALKESLSGSWGVVPGRPGFLPVCRENGLMDRTVFLPYGIIENEPSYPWTNVGMDDIRADLDRIFPANPDLTGVIGNVQTPLLQLPHIYFFTSSLWKPDYRKTSEKDALLQLAGLLYPEHAQLIADCYMGLKDSDSAKVAALADRLDDLVRNNRLGRLGIIGRKLFPDHRVVAEALVLQLWLHATQERLMQTVAPTTSQSECAALISDCLDAYLAWDLTHGWHDFWGWDKIPLVPVSVDRRYGDLIRRLARCLRSKPAVDACLAEVSQALSAKYDPKVVQQGCIAPLAEVLTAMVLNRATWAKATASIVPKPDRYPPDAANDGQLATQYWPGALIENNTEWIQLAWDKPQTVQKVVVRFLQHPSMHGRTIHLQRETVPGKWDDVAVTTIPADAAAPHAVATFQLASPLTPDKIRIVNLLDVHEIEVY